MKRIVTYLFIALSAVASAAAQPASQKAGTEPAAPETAAPETAAAAEAPSDAAPASNERHLSDEELWNAGNDAYSDNRYSDAVDCYTAILERGLYSAKLYYNLANAYFKSGEIAPAILYYNRALRMSPASDDIRYNLEMAEAMTKDKIAVVPEFFLKRWVRQLRNSMSCTAWSIISLAAFAAALAMLLMFLLSGRLALRKTGFYGTIAALLLFVSTTMFALSERRDMLTRQDAVVMSSAISVKSSPDRSAMDLFVLHEGTKVRIVTEIDDWYEIVIADGKKGWTESRNIEQI